MPWLPSRTAVSRCLLAGLSVVRVRVARNLFVVHLAPDRRATAPATIRITSMP